MCRATFFFSKAVLGEKWTGFQKGRAVIKGQSASMMEPYSLVEEIFR